MAKNYRPDIDGLRAIAVLAVVLYHAKTPGFSGGFTGVDVFFVISGFLITGIISAKIDSGAFSVRQFYEKRFRRLLPALTVVLAFTFLAALPFMMPHDLERLGQTVTAASLYVSNIFVWRSTGYFGTLAEEQPLLHTWSLAIEEQFYLGYPILLVALARFRLNRLLVLGGITVVSLLLSEVGVRSFASATFFLLPTRAWELAIGGMASYVARQPPRSGWLATLGALLVALPIFLLDDDAPFPGLSALPTALGTVLLLVANSRDSLVGRVLASRGLVAIGLLSYSLYLWHWPILVYARVYLESGTPQLSAVSTLVALAASILVSWFSWRFVEQPFRSGIGTQNQVFAAAATATITMVALGLATMSAGGFPGRLKEQTRDYASISGLREREDCIHQRREPMDEWSPCEFPEGNEDPPTIALWGDSHSHALLPGVDAATSTPGAFYGMVSCPALVGIQMMDRRRQCLEFNNWALEQIIATPTIHTVVLAGRWNLKAEVGRPEPGRARVHIRDAEAGEPTGDNRRVFRTGVVRTVDRLKASGRRVILLGSTPEFAWDVPRVLSIVAQLGVPMPAVPSRAEYDERNRFVDTLFRELALDDTVEYVPLADTFCQEDCLTTVDGKSAFSDHGHIAPDAARALIPPLLHAHLPQP